MSATIETVTVKVMNSYDYCHFEVALGLRNDDGIEKIDVDNARKDCQRLVDKAIKQYKIAKNMAALRTDGEYKLKNFKAICEEIQRKDEQNRTLREIALLKQLEQETGNLGSTTAMTTKTILRNLRINCFSN